METNQSKQRAVFTEKTDLILSNLLSQYGLQESEEQIIKKDEEDKLSYEYAIIRFARGLIEDKSSEKDLLISLQKELNIPQATIEKVVKDIKEKLIPSMEIVSEKELEKQLVGVGILESGIEEPPIAPIQPPIGLENILKPTTETLPVPKQYPVPQTPKKASNRIKEIKKPPKKQGQDVYKEPVE